MSLYKFSPNSTPKYLMATCCFATEVHLQDTERAEHLICADHVGDWSHALKLVFLSFYLQQPTWGSRWMVCLDTFLSMYQSSISYQYFRKPFVYPWILGKYLCGFHCNMCRMFPFIYALGYIYRCVIPFSLCVRKSYNNWTTFLVSWHAFLFLKTPTIHGMPFLHDPIEVHHGV